MGLTYIICLTDLSCSTPQFCESQAPIRCPLLSSDYSCYFYIHKISYVIFSRFLGYAHCRFGPFTSMQFHFLLTLLENATCIQAPAQSGRSVHCLHTTCTRINFIEHTILTIINTPAVINTPPHFCIHV